MTGGRYAKARHRDKKIGECSVFFSPSQNKLVMVFLAYDINIIVMMRQFLQSFGGENSKLAPSQISPARCMGAKTRE